MKKSRKILLRFLFLVLIVSVLFAIAIPVSAEEYNAGRFITNVQVIGDDLVEVTYNIRPDACQVYVFNVDDGYSIMYSGVGYNHNNIPFQPGVNYRISLSPLGYRGRTNGFDTSTMPSSFMLFTGFGYTYDEYEETAWQKIVKPTGQMLCYSRDSSTAVEVLNLNIYDQNGKTHITSDRNGVNVPTSADIISFEFWWDDVYWQDYPCPTGLKVDVFTIKAVVDKSLFESFQQQWTQGMIGNIQDILGGNIPSKPPSSGNVFEDIEAGEGIVGDFVEDNIGDIDSLANGFYSIILTIGPSLMFFGWILDLFISIPFFANLMNIVLSLGITAFVLNLVITLATRGSRESNKGSEGKKR